MALHANQALPALLALLAATAAVPVQGGTPDAPEVADASGDAKLPPLDIAAAWFDANETALTVHIERGEGADTAPGAIACHEADCAGAGVALRVVFTVLDAAGSPIPALKDYAASYVLVRIGTDGEVLPVAIAGYLDGGGTATSKGNATATIDALSITVSVPFAHEALGLPQGPPAGSRLGSPYALSYVLTCDPAQDCGNWSPPAEQLATLWDRAPDSGVGADYWLPSTSTEPASATDNTTAASATTVTVAETRTTTITHTETHEQTHTVTFTPASESESKASPATGLLVTLAIVALAAVRRRLA